MALYDPALTVAYFYPAGDEGGELLWQILQNPPPGKKSHPRRRRVGTDGATIVQAILERDGQHESSTWPELAGEMERWLGTAWDNPPGRPWGSSRIYLAGSVTGLYEEQQLLREALPLSEMTSRPVATLPTGRLWLVLPPAMTAEGNSAATYAWLHSPREGSRQEVEALWWGEKAPLLRVELYLHRALHVLRQYGPRERADFWRALEEVEAGLSSSPAEENALRRACRTAVRKTAFLNHRHNLLRSGTYLYRQMAFELCPYEGSLFSWYESRLNEALTQWGYDLERADRSIALARTALLVQSGQPAQPPTPTEAVPPAPSVPPGVPPAPARPRPFWPAHLVAAAVIALCLVDENYWVIAARAAALLVLSLAFWTYARFHRKTP
ncbi:MAG: hypothetical protein ACP5OO_01790 [Chloroflexia bacterium]